jgi:hypothetical protein
VNSSRGGGENTIECIGKWSVCTLETPKDKSTFTPNHLPVQVCKVICYKKSDKIRYRCVLHEVTGHSIQKGRALLIAFLVTCILLCYTYSRLCCKDGIFKGTYRREQLASAPQHTAHGLGIFYTNLNGKKIITMTEAGERCCPAGGKFSYCHG